MAWTGIWGEQGAGKTLLLTLILGQEALRRARTDKKRGKWPFKVRCNFQVNFEPLAGILKARREELGQIDFGRFNNDLKLLSGHLDEFQGAVVGIDDLQAIFDSHYWDTVPPDVRLFFITHRHRSAEVFYTIPNWSRADKDIRQNTNRLLHVRRRGRTLLVDEYRVRTDPKDATGQTLKTERVNLFFHHKVKLPFTPRDEMLPLKWRLLRRVARVVEKMFDSWAEIVIAATSLYSRGFRKNKKTYDGKRAAGKEVPGGGGDPAPPGGTGNRGGAERDQPEPSPGGGRRHRTAPAGAAPGAGDQRAEDS